MACDPIELEDVLQDMEQPHISELLGDLLADLATCSVGSGLAELDVATERPLEPVAVGILARRDENCPVSGSTDDDHGLHDGARHGGQSSTWSPRVAGSTPT